MTPDDTDSKRLLLAFIEDEDQALAGNRKASFWSSNHYEIKPAFKRAEALLSPEQRLRLYTHTLRTGSTIPTVSAKDFPLLVAAYRSLLHSLDTQPYARLGLLYCFGFDDQGPLPAGETATTAALKHHQKTLEQVSKYTNLPGQRDKVTKFAEFAAEGERVLQTLRHIAYRAGRQGPYSLGSDMLVFWGFVLIALTSAKTRTQLVVDMLDGGYDIPERASEIAILNKTVRAVLPLAGSDDADFIAVAERLAEMQRERREATETAALARQLGLPLEEGDWSIHIVLYEPDCPKKGLYVPDFVIEMSADPDRQWSLDCRLDRMKFSESDGGIIRNDKGIAGLGAGNLAQLPAWLRSLREEHGVPLILEDLSDIRCGRKRTTAKLLAEWLGV